MVGLAGSLLVVVGEFVAWSYKLLGFIEVDLQCMLSKLMLDYWIWKKNVFDSLDVYSNLI